MKKNILPNGKSVVKAKNNYKGGILLTTILFLFLFSSLFTLVLEEFKLTQQFTQKSKEYYIAKTMVSIFISEIKQSKKMIDKEGYQDFSSGRLTYEYDQKTIICTIFINQKSYTFHEFYQPKQESDELKDK
ncbi:competence type IV pilus minor pilin ComGG [Enterococcus termitis]|uniref:Competence protein ComGG n=2 Tax=Enterococcus termitis TaxID=332950 RepID=A0A1E5H734_9ENTE|nr:competence type IV pilus minor pilin ComGG [Enterococcus termitis]OEG20460.1 hypothetical protein BCR25_01170 [Enterococcus termitis]